MKIIDKRSSAEYIRADYKPTPTINEEAYTLDDLEGKESAAAEREIVKILQKCINSYYSSEAQNIGASRDDLNFLYNDQWTADLRAIRSQKKKAVLTLNYLKAHSDTIMGEEIQNEPDVTVSATEGTISQKDIDLQNDLLRQVFYDNKIDLIKQYTFLYMIGGGFGVIEVGYDYENPKTFNKKITIDWSDDPTMYFFDPRAKSPFKTDSQYWGKIISLTKEDYDLYFPNAKTQDSIVIQYESDDYTYKNQDTKLIRIATVFKREKYEDTIVLLSNGESMTKDAAEELLKEQESQLRLLRKHEKIGAIVPEKFKEKIEIIQEERRICDRIVWYTINKSEILELGEWPGDLVNYIYIPCFEVKLDGVKRSISWHRYAQDAQRLANYVASEACDVLMTSHHKNWMAPAKCFDGQLLDLLLNPQNTSPVLLYNETPSGAKPEYTPPPQLSPEFNNQFQRSVNDIANILGRFEANRGQQGNEKSGRAINIRALFGNLSAIIPFKNLTLGIELVANACLSIKAAVYDTRRTITVRSKNQKERRVAVNDRYLDETKNDMSLTGFKATVNAAISFEAQKEASMMQLQTLISTEPMFAQLLGDLVAENLTVQNMPQIVERIRQFLIGVPVPKIIAKETGMQPPSPAPDPQAQLTQQQAQMMQQEMALKQAKIQNEKYRITLDAQKQISDAIDSHAKNVTDIKKINMQMIAQNIKSQAEIEKASLDNHVDLIKHFNPQLKRLSGNT